MEGRRDAEAPISVRGLTKRFRGRAAVEDVSFDAPAGAVTGFLGPNGAGKTTTIRLLLGLAQPQAGQALIMGRPYSVLDRPAAIVGAVLDADSFHPRRSVEDHLRWMVAAAGLAQERIDHVLSLVELSHARRAQARELSLGMRHRLALAAALLGDPRVLVLDEPSNGLDPSGIRWLRGFLTTFAADGGTVFLSSHLLEEVSRVAHRVVVIDRGRVVAETSVADLTRRTSNVTLVRTPEPSRLASLLTTAGALVRPVEAGGLEVRDLAASRVGAVAARAGVTIHELVPRVASLEDAFLDLTRKEDTDVDQK